MSEPFEFPTHCNCGALLMGSLTRHTADCWVRALIVERFPTMYLPEPPAEDKTR